MVMTSLRVLKSCIFHKMKDCGLDMMQMKNSAGVSARPTQLLWNAGQLLSKECQEDQEGWDDKLQEQCVHTT